jgi:hypothetical protein
VIFTGKLQARNFIVFLSETVSPVWRKNLKQFAASELDALCHRLTQDPQSQARFGNWDLEPPPKSCPSHSVSLYGLFSAPCTSSTLPAFASHRVA